MKVFRGNIMKQTTTLIILDGFGLSGRKEGNAVAAAHTPNLDRLFSDYPHAVLQASGEAVGLPHGQMGNSEVGHLNIGAGRIVYQDLTRITKAIKERTFFDNAVLKEAVTRVKNNGGTLHIAGLLSDGGVHSHIDHLFALLDLAASESLSRVYVHCFLDGRDVPPRCAQTYISQLEEYMKKTGTGRIATVSGRYYAMDRDKRWERVSRAYDTMTGAGGETESSASEALHLAYERGENDEFVLPTAVAGSDGAVRNGDSIVMINFRPDRARELTRAFTDDSFEGFERKVRLQDIYYVCMTQYDASLKNVRIAFPPEEYRNTLGEYLSSLGKKQLRLAETEKYAHVTFFFNGGVEEPNEGEDRILIPSPKVATYDLKPEMSAPEIREAALKDLRSCEHDVIIINFANPDMVGHTGIFDAAVRAVETVDSCVGDIVSEVLRSGGNLFLTADHGNADLMTDEDGSPVTSHSTNPVPAILITPDPTISLRGEGILADIAPTLLDLMDLPQPPEMTGRTLLVRG